MNQKIELKPCPFCGGEAAYKELSGGSHIMVKCAECGIGTEAFRNHIYYCAADKVAEVWNRRADNGDV